MSQSASAVFAIEIGEYGYYFSFMTDFVKGGEDKVGVRAPDYVAA